MTEAVFWQEAIVTSPFGEPRKNQWGFHTGIDFDLPDGGLGADIPSLTYGRVLDKGFDKQYGYFVMLETGPETMAIYSHLLNNPPLRVGDSIRPGTIIGKLGATGFATGPHLHLEIRKNNVPVAPIIPPTLHTKGATGVDAGSVVSQPSATVIEIIQQEFSRFNLDWRFAVAVAQGESNFSPMAVGDNGSSLGIFQLHRQGKLPAFYAAGYTNPFDARQNIRFTAEYIANNADWSPWTVARNLFSRGYAPNDYTSIVQNGLHITWPVFSLNPGSFTIPRFPSIPWIRDIIENFSPNFGPPNISPMLPNWARDLLERIPIIGPLFDAAGQIQDGISGIGLFFVAITQDTLKILSFLVKPANWWRLGFVIFGFLLMITGFTQYIGKSEQLLTVAKLAATKGKLS